MCVHLCTLQELLKNESDREQIKLKAKEVEEKDLALKDKEYEEGLVATPVRTLATGHAATTSFGKQEISKDPSSTGNTFQPGSWMPNPKKQTEILAYTETAAQCQNPLQNSV